MEYTHIGMEYSCKSLGIDRAVNTIQLCILCPQISLTLCPELAGFIFDGPKFNSMTVCK